MLIKACMLEKPMLFLFRAIEEANEPSYDSKIRTTKRCINLKPEEKICLCKNVGFSVDRLRNITISDDVVNRMSSV